MLATAILGALLANRLADALVTQAQAVGGRAARGGAGAVRRRDDAAASRRARRWAPGRRRRPCRPACRRAVADQIAAAAQHTFAAAFTDAMQPVILVAVVVILPAAGAVLFVRSAGDRQIRTAEVVDAG